MLTFKNAQDQVLTRFSEAQRSACKEWIRFVYQSIWGMEEWTFKSAIANVTVTSGSKVVTNLPADLGIIHELQNAQGEPLRYRDWREFQRWHYAEDTTATRGWDWTIIGTGPTAQVLVGPTSGESSSLYQLLYEREACFYPSTTLTGGVTLPAGTLSVADTSQAPASGTVMIAGRLVTYTGVTSSTLTGCSGGTGSFVAGELVVFVSPQAGSLSADTDVPMLPPDTHQVLVHAATAVGQTGENDYSLYLSDDRVQQSLTFMRERYMVQQRDEAIQWGSYTDAPSATGWW